MTQQQIIDSIINNLNPPKNTTPRHTPEFSTKVLWKYADVPPFNACCNYKALFGNLSLLKKSTRPYIDFATHQCDHFCQYHRASHGNAIIHLVKRPTNQRTSRSDHRYIKQIDKSSIKYHRDVKRIKKLYPYAQFA